MYFYATFLKVIFLSVTVSIFLCGKLIFRTSRWKVWLNDMNKFADYGAMIQLVGGIRVYLHYMTNECMT